jgi:subtilisin family serine protease
VIDDSEESKTFEPPGLLGVDASHMFAGSEDTNHPLHRLKYEETYPVSSFSPSRSDPARPRADASIDRNWYEICKLDKGRKQYRLGDPEVVVAVIDSGLALHHESVCLDTPGLFGPNQLTHEWNLVNDWFEEELPQDRHGHGTAVASVVLGRPFEGSPPAVGIAPGCSLMPIKFAVGTHSDTEHLCRAIMLASGCKPHSFRYEKSEDDSELLLEERPGSVDNAKANIIVITATFSDYSRSVFRALRYAREQSIVIFASSGNDGNQNKSQLKPAMHRRVISVAGLHDENLLSAFSSLQNGTRVLAPAELVDVAYLEEDPSIVGRRFTQEYGTSFAAPWAAGALALAWSSFAKQRQHIVHNPAAGRTMNDPELDLAEELITEVRTSNAGLKMGGKTILRLRFK